MKSIVKVTSGRDGIYQHVQARGHSLLSDEPIELGGTDSGPTPFELLLSSLGSCIAITIRLYAKRKQWDFEHTVISLEHERVSKQVDTESGSRVIFEDVILKSVQIEGSLDVVQKAKLLEIAQKCPVHKMLTQGVVILDSPVQ
jgi:putative redox protein